MHNERIAVIGDGGWGTTLAILLHNNGFDVTLWSAFPEYAKLMLRERENKKFLPGIKIADGIHITADVSVVAEFDIYIIAVPCQFLRTTLHKFERIIRGSVISVVKGIENGTLKRPSEIITDILGKVELSVLSGPTIAYEVARNIPSTCVISSQDLSVARLQTFFSNKTFRVYISDDIIGAEIGGSLKNIIAIAAGIADGMGFGVNTKAAILTRGLAEIIRLGVRVGAKKETFSGLTGVGDLATTCMSFHSRNRRFGEEIGRGMSVKDALAGTKMVVEGYATARSGFDLAKKYKVEMPITQEIYKVLYENKNPKQAVRDLMTRAPKSEG